MSYFDDASLAFLPSGAAGKDGKAYSIKPTDGTGDFTFSRGSNLAATRVNAAGLIEKGRENRFTQSNNFSTSPWTSSGTTETSGQSGYDGTSDAWLLNAASAGGYLYRVAASSLSGLSTVSIYAKKGTADGVRLRLPASGSTDANVYINLIDGSDAASATGVISHTVTSLGTGWYRIQMTFNVTSPVDFRIFPANSSGSVVAGTIYIQDTQSEIGLAATAVIETTTTTGTAGILENTPRFNYSNGASCPSLLLEPSRTQLVNFSEYYGQYPQTRVTITDNYGISPDGSQNAAAVFNTTENGRHNFGGNYFAVTSGTSYVNSVFAKAGTITKMKLKLFSGGGSPIGFNEGDFDLTNGTATGTGAGIESYGNGWYRCYVVDSPTSSVSNARFNLELLDASGGVSYVGSLTDYIEIFGSQVEQSSYVSSYIPTYGTSVTRAADSCSVTGASDVIGQTEGTVYYDWIMNHESPNTGEDLYSLVLSNGTNNNLLGINNYNNFLVVFIKNTTTQFSSSAYTGGADGARIKLALAYKVNDFALYINGTQIATDASGSVPALNQINLNSFWNGQLRDNTSVKQLALFKERLTNAELATLTTL